LPSNTARSIWLNSGIGSNATTSEERARIRYVYMPTFAPTSMPVRAGSHRTSSSSISRS
jgi:hypothetical protein